MSTPTPPDGEEPTRVRPAIGSGTPQGRQGQPSSDPSNPGGPGAPSNPSAPTYPGSSDPQNTVALPGRAGHRSDQPPYGQGAQGNQSGQGNQGNQGYGSSANQGGYGPGGQPPYGQGGPGGAGGQGDYGQQGQPYGASAPYPQQSGSGYGLPPGGGYPGAQGAPQGSEPRKSRRKLVIALISAVVVLILVVVGGLLVMNFLDQREKDREAREKGDQEDAAVAATDDFFAAVADGSGEDALAVLAEEPADTTLLSDEVLAAAQTESPVAVEETAIASINADLDEAQVTTLVSVGSESAEWTLDLVRDGDDWKITNELPTLIAEGASTIEANGVAVPEGEPLAVFPGTYTFGTGSDRLEFTSGTTVVVEQGEATWSGEGATEITSAGQAWVIERGTASLQACTEQLELSPTNCPLAVNASPEQDVDPRTIRRTITNDPWSGATVTYSDGVASIRVSISWEFEASGLVNGQRATFTSSGTDSATFFLDGVTSDEPEETWLPF